MKKCICIAIVVVGFSGLIAEISLLRELLIVFSGNELCIGIIFANWLILEAFGSSILGRIFEKSKNQLEIFIIFIIIFSVSLLIAIYFTRNLKNVIGISIGESIGLLPMFYSSFLILLPVSVLHGALFTFSCRIYSRFSANDAVSVGKVYVYETVGTIIGGIVCTCLIIPFLHTFQASTQLALLNFIVCLVLLIPTIKKGLLQKTIITALSILIIASGFFILASRVDKVHKYSIKRQWKNLNIVHYQNSQYGNICVIENEKQYIFFQNGVPNIITPVPNISFVREFTHLSLLAHPHPEKILILSGGSGGIINEVLKHPSIQLIEYAELDPLILELLKKFPTQLTEFELNNKKVNAHHIDGRLLLNSTKNTYDLIFVGIMEPSNLQANRFFTKEFFSLVNQRLDKGGILVMGLPGSLVYSNREIKNLNSCIFTTLKSVFTFIRTIPGDGRNIFLSSDSQNIVSIDRIKIIERLYQRNISAEGLVPWHIEKKLHPGWQNWFFRFIEGSSRKINSDYKPVGLFYNISYWNTLFAPSFIPFFKQFEKLNILHIVIIFIIILLIYFIARSKNITFLKGGVTLTIITTGFAGMIFDLIIIFSFQSMYGYVFSWIGLLVASFMAGAAFGAMFITKILTKIKSCFTLLIKIDLAIICFSFGLPLIFYIANVSLSSPGAFFFFKVIFLVISFISGFLTGSQFPLANKIYLKNNTGLSKTAGLLYASDLMGGWFGGIIGAVVLLPVLGLTVTCITVGFLKLISFIVIITQSKQEI